MTLLYRHMVLHRYRNNDTRYIYIYIYIYSTRIHPVINAKWLMVLAELPNQIEEIQNGSMT